MKNDLTDLERRVIIEKGTEPPFSGEYNSNRRKGTYLCRQCGEPLYRSEHKFQSSCGWPSFDDEIAGAVKRLPDPDGIRTEITCAKCGGHLGHVFTGEKHTSKDVRHCVNSISMKFVPDGTETGEDRIKTETALFAGGSFWGLEYLMKKEPGIISTESGYCGGHHRSPSYDDVCTGRTGHAETVKAVFDPDVTSYEKLAKAFFEMHDPSRGENDGENVTHQYRSAIFCISDSQRETARKLIKELESRGYDVATKIEEPDTFWRAEDAHQDYYGRRGTCPYCHKKVKRF